MAPEKNLQSLTAPLLPTDSGGAAAAVAATSAPTSSSLVAPPPTALVLSQNGHLPSTSSLTKRLSTSLSKEDEKLAMLPKGNSKGDHNGEDTAEGGKVEDDDISEDTDDDLDMEELTEKLQQTMASSPLALRRRDSGASTDSSESFEQYIPVPPDGGWGWVIVVASLLCNMIVDGIGYSFGVFLQRLTDVFEEKKSTVSLVGSLLCGVYMLAGPIVSALTNKFGCRPVAVVGSFVAGIAFFVSSFSKSIGVLMLTYGVMGGFGLGMIYLPAIVSVGYYFEKKRALATGIAVCGSGIGTFVFAPLSEFLKMELDWRGAFIIIAGITLNAAVFSMLMRPLEPPKKVKRPPRAKNLLDRIKEQSKSKRNRTVSETSGFPFGSSTDTNAVLQKVMQAKLLRERRLQDTDSELGSLPSIFFARQQSRKDSAAGGSRVHKLSFSDWGEVSSFLAGGTGDQSSVAGGGAGGPSPLHAPLETVVEGQIAAFNDTRKGDDEATKTRVELLEPSEVNRSEVPVKDDRPRSPGEMATSLTSVAMSDDRDTFNDAMSSVAPLEDTMTIKSDYYTPPSSPTTPVPTSSEKESSNIGVTTRFEISNQRKSESEGSRYMSLPNRNSRVMNGSIASSVQLQIHEIAPLLEVPGAHSKTTLVTLGSDRNLWLARHGPQAMRQLSAAGLSLHSLNVSKRDLARPLYRKDIFYSGSVLNIPQYQSQPDVKSYVTSITSIPGEKAVFEGESKCWQYLCFPQSCKDTLQEMLDFSLLRDPSFLLICLGSVLTFLGFYVPFVYVVDLAKAAEVDDGQAAILISIIGVANTVGRVITGWLADLRKIDSLVITYISIFVCGISTALFPFCTSYVLLCVNAAVFGLCVSAFISLSSILICDLLGLEKLTNGFGLMCVFRGAAAMAGPPLAGAVYDATNSYNASFFMGGGLLAAGALSHLALKLPCMNKYRLDAGQPLTVNSEFAPMPEGSVLFPALMRSASGGQPEIITIEEITDKDSEAISGV